MIFIIESNFKKIGRRRRSGRQNSDGPAKNSRRAGEDRSVEVFKHRRFPWRRAQRSGGASANLTVVGLTSKYFLYVVTMR